MVSSEKKSEYNRRYYQKNRNRLKDQALRRYRKMATSSVIRVTINGKDYDAFPIGELARRMNRSPQTIRKWEREGIIPEALRDPTGRRVYLESHIAAIVRAANECKIEPGQSIAASGFPAQVRESFAHIMKQLQEE